MDLRLDNILIVDMYRAIDNDDPTILHSELNQLDFEELVEEYMELQSDDNTVMEQRIETIKRKLTIIAACLLYLESNLMDEEIMKVMNDLGFEITKDNYPFDMEKIAIKIERLQSKIKRMEGGLPNKKTKKKANSKPATIYEILANMSAGLDGIYLDPRKLVVTEFIAFQGSLSRKVESYEKVKNK